MSTAAAEWVLPFELWNIIILDVEPRWRFLLRRVCRRWRQCVDGASPCIDGFRQNSLCLVPWVLCRKHHWQVKWARGRIVCASLVCDWVRTRPDLWSDGERLTAWVDEQVADVPRKDVAIAMISTCVPALVEYALGTMLPSMVDMGARASDPQRFWPPLGHYDMINDPIYMVGAAAVRTRSAAVIDAVASAVPFALTTSLAMDQVIRNDDVDTFERIAAITSTCDRHLFVIESVSGPRILAHWLQAADDPRGRDWPACVSAFLSDHENIEYAFGRAIDEGRASCLDLWASRLGHIDVDYTVERACMWSSVDSVRWLLDRERSLPDGNVPHLVERIVLGSVLLGACDSGVCSSEALIAWLCDGPLAFDPTAADVSPNVSLAALFALAVGPDGDPRCALWMMERWPRECSIALSPALVAQVVTRTCGTTPYGMPDVRALERIVIALETVAERATPRRSAALVDGVDVWSLLWSTLADQLSREEAALRAQDGIEWAYDRWADRDVLDAEAMERMEARLADIEAYARYARHYYRQSNGGQHHTPYADVAVWRRWCRVRPMSAIPRRSHAVGWAKKTETITDAWLTRRGLLLPDDGA